MKNIIKSLLLVSAVAVVFSACTAGGDNPGIEYAPDMVVSKGYEPLSQVGDNTINPMGMNMRLPAPNTIARGQLSFQYPFPKNIDGYTSAKAELKNPLAASPENLAEGKRLYNINCAVCHGEEGKGDGPVAAKFPPNNIPSYQSDRIKSLPEGGMYHSITYGINLMGSYASVLTPDERWKVIQYVQ